jgi:acetolactate synthase-1/2/3 large subunit
MACANKTLSRADLVIFIGTQTSDQTTLDWTAPLPDVRAVQIDIEASELGRNYPNSVGLLGDAKTVTAQLANNIAKNNHPQWREEVTAYVCATLAEYELRLTCDSTPVRPERLCLEIGKVLPDDAVLVSDTGYSAIWTATMLRMRPTQRYLRAAGSLGWAFPASLGVKCGAPKRPVVCFAGDGAFFYHLSEMETACRYGINTVTIINNNRALGQCRKNIRKLFEDNPERAEAYYTFTSINLSRIAQEFGCFAVRVERPEDIGPAVQQALAAGKPAVLEVKTDPTAVTPEPR